MHAVASSTFLARWGGWPTSHNRNDNPIRVSAVAFASVLTRLVSSHVAHVKLGIDGPSLIDRCYTDHSSRPRRASCVSALLSARPVFPSPVPPDMPLGINPFGILPPLQPTPESSTDPMRDGRSCAGATAERLCHQGSDSIPEVTPGIAVRRASCVAQDVIDEDARHYQPPAVRDAHATRADRG